MPGIRPKEKNPSFLVSLRKQSDLIANCAPAPKGAGGRCDLRRIEEKPKAKDGMAQSI